MQLPTVQGFFSSLQGRFQRAYFNILSNAQKVYKEKGQFYDKEQPVWFRVEFPEGLLHEVTKKAGRVKTMITAKDDWLEPERWHGQDGVREELIDIANYALFMAAIGDLFVEDVLAEEERETRHVKQVTTTLAALAEAAKRESTK